MAKSKGISIPEPVQHPAKCLLRPAVVVMDFDHVLADLSERMFLVMYKFNGIGLAANQIGSRYRLAVLHVPGWPQMVMVNPQITKTKGESTAEEGCLSVERSRHWVPVKRAQIVWAEYRDLLDQPQRLKATALLARCIQHECDHLDGLTCLEKSP